jgi:hypothetical protein
MLFTNFLSKSYSSELSNPRHYYMTETGIHPEKLRIQLLSLNLDSSFKNLPEILKCTVSIDPR